MEGKTFPAGNNTQILLQEKEKNMSTFWQTIIMIVIKWFLEELSKKDETQAEELGKKAGKFANGFKDSFKFNG